MAVAGGLGPFAKPTPSIFSANKMARRYAFLPLQEAVAGKSENVALQPGDVVVVP